MNEQDVKFLLDANIGSKIIMDKNSSQIVGKFSESYIHEKGSVDAYILSLDGRKLAWKTGVVNDMHGSLGSQEHAR